MDKPVTQAALKDRIERYKAELLAAAARSTLPFPAADVGDAPAPAELEGLPSPAPAPVSEAVEPTSEVNPPESGLGQDPLQPIEPEWDSYEQFARENPKTGTLRIQVGAAQQAVPVADARVEVSQTFRDGRHVFATGVTDENGILDGIVLPAPDKALAESPTGEAPYASYNIRVTHPGYRTEVYLQVPVFDGIKSIQPVRFVPDRS